ncbi:hypothetical protein C2E21_6661 [Chlorella sorokiniana]|uniref:Uncharacterized protein n=1 Tax=Chlorella sorokiniana TaxID=3076 RepID=A0A2P6TK22_CHLSO|nr:hypothetical protein C2E21_6661 [Chlorella sorokiniana]|eukprot:PRW44425.1 hypothetical protein C2E21_6661 [Chlorella sorokiniana]
MDKLRELKNKVVGAGSASAGAGASSQMGASASGMTAQAGGPPAISTEAPKLSRISTEYGEVEGQPFIPGLGVRRGPLSPRAQAVKDRLARELEESTRVIG